MMADQNKKESVIGEPTLMYVKKPAPQRSGYKVSQWTKKKVQFEAQNLDTASGSVPGVLLIVHRNRPRKVSENKAPDSSTGPGISPPAPAPMLATSPTSPDPNGGRGHLQQHYNSRYSLHNFLSPSNTLLYRCKSRTQEHAFAICVNGIPLVYLAGCNEQQTQKWMHDLRTALWPPSSVLLLEETLGNVYYVSLVDNDFSYRAGLLGVYGFLQIGERSISLMHAQKSNVIQEWPLNAIEMQPVHGPADLEEPWPSDQQPNPLSPQQSASSPQSPPKNAENAKPKQINSKKAKPTNLLALRTFVDSNNAKGLIILFTEHVEAILVRFTEAKQQWASLSSTDDVNATSDSGLSLGNSLSGSLARQTSMLSNELVTELQSIFDNQQKQLLQQQQQQMLLQQTQMNHQALLNGQRSQRGLPANTSSDDLLADLLMPSSPLSGNKLPDNGWSSVQQNVANAHSTMNEPTNVFNNSQTLSSNNPFADAFATYSNLQQLDANKYPNNLNASREDLDLLDEDSEQEGDLEPANSETRGGTKWSVGDTLFESSKQKSESQPNINSNAGPTQRSFTPNYTLDLSDLVAEQQQQEQMHLSAIYSLATSTTASAPQPVPSRPAPNVPTQRQPSFAVSAKSRLQTQHSLPPSSLPVSHQIPPLSSANPAAGLSPTQAEAQARRDFDWSMFNEQKKSQVPKVKSFDQLVDLDQLVVKKTSSASQLPQGVGEPNPQLANQITGSQSCTSFRHLNAQSPLPTGWNSDLQSSSNVQLGTSMNNTNPFLISDFHVGGNLHNPLGSSSNITNNSINANYLMPSNTYAANAARNSGNFTQSPLVFEHEKVPVQPVVDSISNNMPGSFDFEKELSRLNIDFKKRSAPPTSNPSMPTSVNQPASYSVGLSASGELGSNSALAAAVSKPLNPFLTSMDQPIINNGQFPSSSTTNSNNTNGLFDGFTA